MDEMDLVVIECQPGELWIFLAQNIIFKIVMRRGFSHLGERGLRYV